MDLDALYEAAMTCGDADAIAKFEMEADKLDRWDRTILHIESANGNTERVRFILRAFADKNLFIKLDIHGKTALHLAAYGGHTQVAEILIDAARYLPNDNTHDNPVTSFKAFLRQGDMYMDTALHAAVTIGNVAIVKLLVEADPSHTHFQDIVGKTPMYMAVKRGFNDIVEIISTTCTSPTLDGPDGSTAMRIKNVDQAKSPGGPLYKIMNKDALYAAAIAGDADAIAVLEIRADKSHEYVETILHTESREGNTEHVRFILREFASKNLLVMLGDREETALYWAAYNGHTEVVEVLIDALRHLPPGDNPITYFQDFIRHADKYWETALHAAVEKGHVDITKLLVQADPSHRHSRNKHDETPMYIAAKKGYNNIVNVMCTTCTNPSFEGPDGSTALHAAIKHPDHDTEVVNLLIGVGYNYYYTARAIINY